MVELVYGGSGSGKSEYGEGRCCALAAEAWGGNAAKKYYIATMIPYGEEGQRRVSRHRKLRDGKGFETVEIQLACGFGEFAPEENALVLVECIGNLTANEMFREEAVVNQAAVVEAVLAGVEALLKKPEVRHCVIVTNNVFEDGLEYDETTRAYMRALGKINMRLAQLADQVTEVVCGIPVVVKSPEEEK